MKRNESKSAPTKRRTPIVLVAALLAMTCGLFTVATSTAGAAQACSPDGYDYGASITLAANPSLATPGQVVTLTGSGFPPACDLELQIDGAVIGTVTTAPDGTFSFHWNVPDDQGMGVTVDAVAGGTVLASTIISVGIARPVGAPVSATTTTVIGNGTVGATGTPSSTTSTTSLPATGASISLLVIGGVLMLVAGAALLLWNRGRDIPTA